MNENKKFTELTSTEFLDKLASANPVPGGGGGAAMAGALAAALGSMVGNLTKGKEKFAANEAEIIELLGQLEEYRHKCLQLVEEDAKVFAAFMACYKLPKSTDEEKAARSKAISSAAKNAAAVPLEIGRVSLEVLRIAARLVVIGNPNVVTDGAVSAILARAALRSASYNVRINLPLAKDAVFSEAVACELAAMDSEAAALEREVLQKTEAALG